MLSARTDDRLGIAQEFLDQHRVFRESLVSPENFETQHAMIAGSRDPESKFGPVIFAFANPKVPVLTPEQRIQLSAVIEQRNDGPVNWHDARNIVRVQSLIAMWAYAAASNAAEVARLDQVWRGWNDLRLAYMFEEYVARERFQRAAWAAFTPEKRQRIVAGNHDSLIKKNVGHRRAFSANKQVIKMLGAPANPSAFNRVVAQWEKQWEAVSEQSERSDKFNRQREWLMDQTDEAFAVAAWPEQETAFRNFTQSERDAIRDLIQVGYSNEANLAKKITTIQQQLRTLIFEKYTEYAEQFLPPGK
tara:strand:- start:4525 stop:5436 length:912 start_codon:yes stop_codon:yes gene_type:complete